MLGVCSDMNHLFVCSDVELLSSAITGQGDRHAS